MRGIEAWRGDEMEQDEAAKKEYHVCTQQENQKELLDYGLKDFIRIRSVDVA